MIESGARARGVRSSHLSHSSRSRRGDDNPLGHRDFSDRAERLVDNAVDDCVGSFLVGAF